MNETFQLALKQLYPDGETIISRAMKPGPVERDECIERPPVLRRVVQYLPAFFSGFDDRIDECASREELEALDYVRAWINDSAFHQLSVTKTSHHRAPWDPRRWALRHLMAELD